MQTLPKDMELGDIVQIYEGTYGCATVEEVSEKEVILFRPYVQTSDFAYGGQNSSRVIPYIGSEKVNLRKDSSRTYFLLRKGSIRV